MGKKGLFDQVLVMGQSYAKTDTPRPYRGEGS